MNILDTGTMDDNKGNTVSFRNAIIVFTTNLGCTKDTGKAVGMGLVKEKSDSATKATILKAIENYFSPEFLGRLDDIVYYNSLNDSAYDILIDRYLNEYKAISDVNVKFTKADYAAIRQNAEIETRGARGVRRAVRKQIVEVEDREEENA